MSGEVKLCRCRQALNPAWSFCPACGRELDERKPSLTTAPAREAHNPVDRGLAQMRPAERAVLLEHARGHHRGAAHPGCKGCQVGT